MRTITYSITPAHAGMSVERYLKQQHGYSTRTLVKLKHYPQGLQLNGRHVRTIDLLQAGDTLAVTFLDSQEHGVEHFIRSNRRVEIPYEDDDLLVFNKPADMPCHQSCGHAADTLANVFAAHCDHLGLDLMYRPLNRLDRDTSGAVLVAKNRFAAAKVTNNFHKTYQAILLGCPPQPQGRRAHPPGIPRGDAPHRRPRRPACGDKLPGAGAGDGGGAAAFAGRLCAGDRPHPPDPGAHGPSRLSGAGG